MNHSYSVSVPSPMKKSQVSTSSTHCWKSFSPGRKCWTCVGWDGVLISSSTSAAFWSQQIGNSLLKILCRPGMSSYKTFTHVPLAPWGEYAQQWSMQQEDTGDIDFVTSILTSQFSATSQNTKNAFCKFQVWLTIWKITWAFVDSLFKWAICHG